MNHCALFKKISGQFGYIFMDLGEKFVYRTEKGPEKVLSNTCELNYPSFLDSYNTPWILLSNKWGLVSKLYTYFQMILKCQENFGYRPNKKQLGIFKAMVDKLRIKNKMPENYLSSEEIDYIGSKANDELNHISAIMGGILGQEVIKAISGKGFPTYNIFLYDGTKYEGKIMLAYYDEKS